MSIKYTLRMWLVVFCYSSAVTAVELNEQRELYFGDTHIHTSLSFDAYLSGNRLGLDEAYRFAKGEKLDLTTGETAQLSRPLDFVVMTDHAESYGLFEICGQKEISETQRKFCGDFEKPSRAVFRRLRAQGVARPPQRMPELCDGNIKACLASSRITWNKVREAAEKYNEPGVFTAFSGYEYSPVLPKQGKVHRNVIFKNKYTPGRVVSAFDALSVLDLWSSLEAECTDKCEFLTIPHNMNKTWGLAYSGRTIDGDAYEDKDWLMRGRNEPLAEIFQIKGNSECGLGLGASDEECNFELIAPLCQSDQVDGCSGRTSFAREGLKIGLQLEQRLGINPLRIGFVGSTDTHISTPGDTEENDYRGSNLVFESPAKKRLGLGKNQNKKMASIIRAKNPGGLAAVWARANTRDEIFSAMQRRETYATSGTRIKLRLFAGWGFGKNILDDADFLNSAYAKGVPMGDVLAKNSTKSAPEFLVWAMQDTNAAPLQKVQMIKAWLEDGTAQEQVVDIACSDGLAPDVESGLCPNNGAKVSLKDCSISTDKGDSEIKVRWTDPNFKSDQSAVYYVRILENPSCRWSTYDSVHLGLAPPKDVPATIQERAWSSPIWYTAPSKQNTD